MSITVTCDHCKKTMKVPDDMAGKRGRCPSCKNKITVPSSDAGPAKEPPPQKISQSGVAAGEPPAQAPPTPVYCPECREEVEADPVMAGEMVACPHCEHQFQMPGKKKAKKAAPVAPAKDGGININISHSGAAGDAPPGPSRPGTGFAITGMVLGIIALVASLVPYVGCFVGLVLAVLGIVFSSIALRSVWKAGQGKGMAITGLSTSVLALVWQPLAFFFVAALVFTVCCGGAGLVKIDPKQGGNVPIPQPQKGSVKLQFAPTQKFEGIEIFVDNAKVEFKAVVGNVCNLEVTPGQHLIEIRMAGNQPFTQRIVVNQPALGPTLLNVPIMVAK